VSEDPWENALPGVLRELCHLSREAEWVEFKRDNADPNEIGEYLSALSNTAALLGKAHAYLVRGVADGSHEIVGTKFRPFTAKVGNEELESWLLHLLSPRIDFQFHDFLWRVKP